MPRSRRSRYTTVRIRRPRELARVRREARRESGRAPAWKRLAAIAGLAGAALGGVVLVTELAGTADQEAGATDVLPSVRAHDTRNHVVFRRTGRTLTIKIGRRAPEPLRGLRGAVRLECVHLGPGGDERTYSRRLGWPFGARFNSLQLPGPAASAMRECALSRRGRTLARATF